jgi:hypothetical protein
MAIVIINLETQYLPDGYIHISSPDVPGFHVVDHERKGTPEQFFLETALPVLQDTIGRRVIEAKIGERVQLRWKEILGVKSVTPAELARRVKLAEMPPRHLIAEIS